MAETVASPEPGLRMAAESWGRDVQQFGEISGLPPDARLVPGNVVCKRAEKIPIEIPYFRISSTCVTTLPFPLHLSVTVQHHYYVLSPFFIRKLQPTSY
jgi:hypothetical protein